MGGRVGLKGTDGTQTLAKALELGAVPEARRKAARALAKLVSLKDKLIVVTCAGDMGESVARELGFTTEIVYPPNVPSSADEGVVPSTGEDTRAAAKLMAEHQVDLLLFAGGDGTARDRSE